jgi:hypothetical protein
MSGGGRRRVTHQRPLDRHSDIAVRWWRHPRRFDDADYVVSPERPGIVLHQTTNVRRLPECP